MAISGVTLPTTWARVNDTNRLTYKFSSTKSSEPNFQYQFNMRYYNVDGTYVDLGSYNLHPSNDGTVEFNPSEIYKNGLSYDLNLAITALEEAEHTALKFQLFVYDFYSDAPNEAPYKHVDGSWYESTPMNIYNGCQMPIPYDYTALNTLGNNKWVMIGSAKQGQFLTDATEYRLDNTDLLFLWFLGGTNGRPTRIRYTIVYWGAAVPPPFDGMYGGYDRSQPINTQGLPTSSPIIGLDEDEGVPAPGTYWSYLTAITYDTNITYTYANSLAYYFPCGPQQQTLNSGGTLYTHKDTWLYYDIDILSGSTVMNQNPIRVYRSSVCNKYGAWQMFWLNPHGGFDTYTFDKKNDLEYKIKRDTYKKKLPPTYSTYDAGERVYNTQIEEQLTLRTKSLTQKEAQLITQMSYSPVVYALLKYEYKGVPYYYGVPYIVVNDSFKYEQKVNSKEIDMEIKVRPANQRIIQRN